MSRQQQEYLIEKSILEYLSLKGVFAWKNKNGATYDPTRKAFRRNTTLKGIADILGILPCGTFLAIEVKRDKQYPTKEQKEFLINVNRMDGIGFVARSVKDVQDRLIDVINVCR